MAHLHLRINLKPLRKGLRRTILYVTAVLVPPLAVYLRRGTRHNEFAVNIVLTLLGWYVSALAPLGWYAYLTGGVLHALHLVTK
ncbi:hypothetical protein VTJ83DRAFT_4543 [Remersonia thermophila]|uniref:YqaE/Pmp3 family membrane protein n=1 Tax=Remersonia thermophila TaxID=72144 RepID=A0ABR4DA86_9PEZI